VSGFILFLVHCGRYANAAVLVDYAVQGKARAVLMHDIVMPADAPLMVAANEAIA
jgi:hypothetical protein